MLTIEEYQAKREARYNRLLAAASKAERESGESLEAARKMSDFIPSGQPVLVDHYSFKRDVSYRARIQNKYRKGFELAKRADELKNRAASIKRDDKIYNDDPQASEKLENKLETLLIDQKEMKRINTALRKGANFDTLEMSEKHRAELLSIDKHQAYYQPKKRGFPPYMLSNNNAKIKATKQRAEIVERKQTTPDKDEILGEIKIHWRPSENRIRVYFPARVDIDTFKQLKQHGFRVLRSEGEGAFSAYYNSNAAYFVKMLRERAK